MSETPGSVVPKVLAAAAAVLLAGDVLQVLDRRFAFTVVLAVSFALFAWGHATLSPRGGRGARLVAVGRVLAFVGSLAGAAMQVLFRAESVLAEAGRADAVEALGASAPLTMTTLTPGILFPLGLIVLAVGLFRSGRAHPGACALLAVGGVLFPVGHAVGIPVALIGGDVVLLPAFGWLAFGPARA